MNKLILYYSESEDSEVIRVELGQFKTANEANMNRDILERKWKDANPVLSQGYNFYCWTTIE
jgi:hypothetical protein